MKKVISVKEIMVILISAILITISNSVLGINTLFGDTNNTVSPDDYQEAQSVPDGNNTPNNTTKNIVNNKVNNSNGNNSALPQTGIEDYNVGILLIICVGSAIFAYKKINDYKSI